jgi:hypothetical protein
MSDVLTYDQIKERYDGEWVLVGDPELTEMNEVVRGTVLAHSPDRDEVYHKLVQLRPRHSAMECFKHIPDDVVIVL